MSGTTFHYDSLPLTIIELCRDADFTLRVGQSLIKVSRNTLCMASPVFRAMLTGQSTEAPKDEIELFGDSPDALVIVLRIAHLRCSEVKRTFPHHHQLHNVATICDKYDMVAICRPYVPGWIEKWFRNDGYLYYRGFLWTTWVFGYEKEFTRITDRLRLNIYVDAGGLCKTSELGVLSEKMPPNIVESLLKVRSEVISTMLEKFNVCVRDHATKYQTCKALGMFGQNCQAFILGQLIRASAKLSEWPLQPVVADISSSASDVYSLLTTITLDTYKEPVILGNITHSHAKCNVGVKMQSEIKRIFDEMPSPVLESHRIHMREQWRKGNPDPVFM